MRSEGGRRVVLTTVFVVGVGIVLAVLSGWSPGSPVRVLLGVAAALLWTARVATLDEEALRRGRLGPAALLAGAWLAGLLVLETCAGGWSGNGVVVLVIQSALAGGMALVAWGKARLALPRSRGSGHGGRVSRD